MTPTPGGQPKPQSSQQPGNEPGGANGMYGRFGQTPGQQPSQGFRQKVDGVRRGFGGRQQRGGMRQGGGMGQMQNNNAQGQAPQQDPVGYDGRPVQRQAQPQSNEQTAYRRNAMQPSAGDSTGFNPQPSMSLGQMQNGLRSFIKSKTPGVVPQGDSLGINGQPVDRSQDNNVMTGRSGQSNARQADRSQDQGREEYSKQLRSMGATGDNTYGEGAGPSSISGMGPATGNANARQADRSQDQGQASSYRTSGQYDRDRAGGMQDGAVSGRETLFNATQQPMQQDQPDYGRFAPGPAADAQERAAANPFGGAGYGSGQYGSAFGNTQQPMNNAAQSTPVAPVRNTQNMGSDQPMPTATTTQAQPSVAPVQNTQNMGGQQSPPVAQTTQATPAPSGFASPFGMMRFGAPPAQPEQPQAEDMQPRETFQTGQSSLRQPLPSLEGQSRRRQRDRFGYGA